MSKFPPIAPLVLALAVVACTPSMTSVSTSTSASTKPRASTGPATGATPKAGASAGTRTTLGVGEVVGHVFGPPGYKASTVPAPKPGQTWADVKAPSPAGTFDPGYRDEQYQEQPVAGVEVYLASQKGERFDGSTLGKADAQGRFVIKNVPRNLSFLIMTNTTDPAQRHAELCGIMQTVDSAEDVKITFGGTIVTLNTMNQMAGNALGAFQANIYVQLTAAVDAKLKGMNVSKLPDVSNIEEVKAFMADVTVGGRPASALIGDLRTSLQQNGVDANSVQSMLNSIQFSGQGSASVNGQQTAAGSTAGTIQVPPNLLDAIFGAPATPSPGPSAE